jgi:hypothetical protein
MANIVVIESVSRIADQATATGTVNGQPVTVSFWFSALASFASTAQAQAFIAGLMIAAVIPTSAIDLPLYTGTVND